MAKRTTIIDIGSNSITLVIYEKSSRFAFHLIEKVRSSVRIGEGAYENGGILTHEAMRRAFLTLKDFIGISKSYKSKKILCVATSALRDAPNKKEFLKLVRDELKLNIRVIDGKKEAYFGALGAINLLFKIEEATVIDIGGGSTELAKIKDFAIVDTISLDVGTVRLKELFFDKKRGFKEAKAYIKDFLKDLPEHFRSDKIIGIGGTVRALSKALMRDRDYPVDTLHAFEYEYGKYEKFIKKVAKSSVLSLKDMPVSSSRYDTIREGSTIFYTLNRYLGTKDVVTSKAGVREGVYLADILRNSNLKFPHNFNISIRSLIDRFALLPKNCSYSMRLGKSIYDAVHHEFDKEREFEEQLLYAAKLILIFNRLNIYSNSDHSFFFLLENLNFTFSHKEKILIATLLLFSQKARVDIKIYKRYKDLLPSSENMKWLVFILSLNEALIRNKTTEPISLEYNGNVLKVIARSELFLAKEAVKKIKKPKPFAVMILKEDQK